ncbi:unnamed protein product [Blepharisma stoltei]|uniref:Uncharacterized protein n=1 Tax=Blepharisma stoltei TaxID=1481888 RepID=A0AAU9KFC6_9CILI|nr:unnamed protein product [Blepharisma stoltei]
MVFSRRKSSSGGQQIFEALNQQLEQLKVENSDLKLQLEDNKESAQRNKALLEDFIKQTSQSDQIIQDLRTKLEELNRKANENELRIKDMRTEKFQLTTEKESFRDTQPSGMNNMQDILNSVEKNEELLLFKDSKNCVWQIIRRPEMKLDEAEMDIEEDTSKNIKPE